ncbi:MAG: hypothetical protein CM15mP12_5680 [Gammaproteobacteria bacterium]|nr:MAG: hypothetical protein CM15mP12_5680 [Gammaproteobacteria bacterium]
MVARDRSKKLTVFGQRVENVTKGFELAYTYDSLYRNEHHGDTIRLLMLLVMSLLLCKEIR